MLQSYWVKRALSALVMSIAFVAHAAAAEARRIEVSAGDLLAALQSLAEQVDVDLVYQDEQVKGVRTTGVSGNLSPHDALEKLLAGTPLRLRVDAASGAILITPVAPATVPTSGTQPVDPDVATVVVTGSRIPTLAVEGPSPVTVLTRDEMEARGFATVLEAAKSLTQVTGQAQNEGDSRGFTPNAGAINLRGLGPGRSLVLFDGRRIADYPLPYQGLSNFVNLNTIPAAAVERVELLAGGASAIYGSDAVAGVLNIIPRKRVDTPLDITVRYSGMTQGGGESYRIQAAGGLSFDRFDVIYAAEYLHQDPMYGLDRDFMDSVEDNPNPDGRLPPPGLFHRDPFDFDGDGLQLNDPGSEVCARFQNMVRAEIEGGGFYCGQPNAPAQSTLRNSSDRASLYTRVGWDVGDSSSAYIQLNYFQSAAATDPNFSQWLPLNSPLIFNMADQTMFGGSYNILQRVFQQDEIGGREGREVRYDERLVDTAVGIKGDFGSSSWRYDAGFNTSRYTVKQRQRLLLEEEASDYFLGPQLGFDFVFGDIPAYRFDWGRFYEPLTPQIWNELTDINNENSRSANDTAQVVVNGELFQLPAGALAMAGVLEYGRQSYRIDSDPQLEAGDFWGVGGISGGGERDRAALGLELRVPILRQLDAQLAGRYDNYDDGTNEEGAVSYNVGLTYRPIRQLLLRGSLATNFRAPDMHFIFAEPSSLFTLAPDEYLCRRDQPGVPASGCDNGRAQFEVLRTGNPQLREERGRTITAGLVFEPAADFAVTADYYRIRLEDGVFDNPAQRVLRAEADCRLGVSRSGEPVDINSPECQDAIARVRRRPADDVTLPETLLEVATNPINTAHIDTTGVDAGARYRWRTRGWGNFSARLGWSHTLTFEEQLFPGNPPVGIRDLSGNYNWRSRVNGSVGWGEDRLSVTTYAERLGSAPRLNAPGRLGSTTYVNLSATYRLARQAIVSFSVNNVFDRDPPRDVSFDAYPYFSYRSFSPFGREWALQLRYRFEQ